LLPIRIFGFSQHRQLARRNLTAILVPSSWACKIARFSFIDVPPRIRWVGCLCPPLLHSLAVSVHTTPEQFLGDQETFAPSPSFLRILLPLSPGPFTLPLLGSSIFYNPNAFGRDSGVFGFCCTESKLNYLTFGPFPPPRRRPTLDERNAYQPKRNPLALDPCRFTSAFVPSFVPAGLLPSIFFQFPLTKLRANNIPMAASIIAD